MDERRADASNAMLFQREAAGKGQSVEALKGPLIPAEIRVEVTRNYGETATEKANELLYHLGLATVSIIVLVVGVPYLILYRALRKGTASDRQVVQRSQRPVLMASAATAVTIALVVLYVAGAPKPLVWLVSWVKPPTCGAFAPVGK